LFINDITSLRKKRSEAREERSWERAEDLEAWTQKKEEFKLRQLTGSSTV